MFSVGMFAVLIALLSLPSIEAYLMTILGTVRYPDCKMSPRRVAVVCTSACAHMFFIYICTSTHMGPCRPGMGVSKNPPFVQSLTPWSRTLGVLKKISRYN